MTTAFFVAIFVAVVWCLIVDLGRRQAVARYQRERERQAGGPEPEPDEMRHRRLAHQHREDLRPIVTAVIGELPSDRLSEPELTVVLRRVYHPTVDLTRFTEHGEPPAIDRLTSVVTRRLAAQFGRALADDVEPEARAVFDVRARRHVQSLADARERAERAATAAPPPMPRPAAWDDERDHYVDRIQGMYGPYPPEGPDDPYPYAGYD